MENFSASLRTRPSTSIPWKGGGPATWAQRRRGAVERERVEQKDPKIRKYEEGSEQVIGALIEVHRALGPGLLESAYEACFCHELSLCGLAFERQRPVGITHKGLIVTAGTASVSAGLLVNFNVTSLRQGLRRLSLPPPEPS